jgi:hypothetical protein
MNAQHVELCRRIEQYQLDSPEAALPFSARLARENNWSVAYANRVIAEYKRFTFRAVAAGHPVSPSEDVDQAWHLHLTYSENYWKVFCPEILGNPFIIIRPKAARPKNISSRIGTPAGSKAAKNSSGRLRLATSGLRPKFTAKKNTCSSASITRGIGLFRNLGFQ